MNGVKVVKMMNQVEEFGINIININNYRFILEVKVRILTEKYNY